MQRRKGPLETNAATRSSRVANGRRRNTSQTSDPSPSQIEGDAMQGRVSNPPSHAGNARPRAGRTFVNPADVGPRQQTGRGYSTSSGLTERWRTAQLKRPNSGPTAWQRGQTLELKDGPTSNPRKRGDETPRLADRKSAHRPVGAGFKPAPTTNQTPKTCNTPAGHTDTPSSPCNAKVGYNPVRHDTHSIALILSLGSMISTVPTRLAGTITAATPTEASSESNRPQSRQKDAKMKFTR